MIGLANSGNLVDNPLSNKVPPNPFEQRRVRVTALGKLSNSPWLASTLAKLLEQLQVIGDLQTNIENWLLAQRC